MKVEKDVKKELEFEFLIHKPNKEHMEVPMESPMCKAYLETIKAKNEAEEALKAIPEYQAREKAWEAKEKANRAVEATPEFKKYWKAKETTEEAWKANEAWKKARKAIDKKGAYCKTPEYKAWEKADKAEYKLYMFLVRTPEWKAKEEAAKTEEEAYKALAETPEYKDYMKASCVCSKMKQYYLKANWNWIDARRSAKSTLKEEMDEEAW